MLACLKNFAALAVIFAAAAASIAAQVIAMLAFKGGKNGIPAAFLHGVLAGMLFPQDYPVFSVFLLTLFVFLTAKYAFGGISGTWLNAAALAAAIAYMIGPQFFPAPCDVSLVENIQNPSKIFLREIPVLNDGKIIDFFNTRLFRFLGTSVPDGYISFLWDSVSTIPAYRFSALILASSLFLVSFNMLNWIIPACFLASYLTLIWLFGGLALGSGFARGDILLASLTGGTLFTAFFLLDWFGTVPLSHNGKIIYGIIAGIIAFFLLGYGFSPSGAAFTVLASNLASTFIQYFEALYGTRRLRKKLIPAVIGESRNEG
jgi:electron transport complex protein RnfD